MKKIVIIIGMLFCAIGNSQSLGPLPLGSKSDSIVQISNQNGRNRLKYVPISTLATWINDAITGGSADNQQLSLSGNVISLERGGSVDLTPILPVDQTIQTFSFNSTSNTITLQLTNDTVKTLDLSTLSGGSGTDNQQLSRAGNIITLEDGGNVDISDKQDNLISGVTIKTLNNQPILGSGNLVVSGGGASNPNIIVATTLADITNAGVGSYIDIQGTIILTANYTISSNQTWHFTTGSIDLSGFTLTGNNTKIITNGSNLAIDSVTGLIDGTWERPEVLYMKAFGMRPDGLTYNTGSITTGTNILTVTGASFSANDVGKFIAIKGAITGYSDTDTGQKSLVTTISSVTNSTTVVLSTNATRTVSNQLVWTGTNNNKAGINGFYIQNQGAGTTVIPEGNIFAEVVDFSIASKPLWVLGQGADDVNIKAYGSILRMIPHGFRTTRFIQTRDTHRLSWEGGIIMGDHEMHNYSNEPTANTGEDFNIGLWPSTATYNASFKNLDIKNLDGTGMTCSGTLNFINYIQGTNHAGGQQVSDMTYGTINPTTGAVTADTNAKFAYTTNLIDIGQSVFEETRAANPDRKGLRHYSFSGSSFAGWSGLKTPRYWAYYYDSSGTYLGQTLGESDEQRFYWKYQYEDNIKYVRIVIDRPDDLADINTQVRAPIDPEGIIFDNVNVYDCLAHGGSNLASGTVWQNSTIARIGKVEPGYGINIEDQRAATQNITLKNITFYDNAYGDVNLVGTVNVIMEGLTHLGTTKPGHSGVVGNTISYGASHGRDARVIGSFIRNGRVELDRNNLFSNNVIIGGLVESAGNGSRVTNNTFHNVTVVNDNPFSADRSFMSFTDNKFTYDKPWGGFLITDTNNTIKWDGVDIIFNDKTRLNFNVTDASTFEEIVIGEGGAMKLFNASPAPTKDYGGYIKNFSMRGARQAVGVREGGSNNGWPVVDMYNVYTEESITLSTGLEKSRLLEKVRIDGWLHLTLTNFGNTLVAPTPTLTFKELILNVNSNAFTWTTTNAWILDSSSKNVNLEFEDSEFNLNVASGVLGATDRYFRLRHLGTTLFKDCKFHSETSKTIDFTNTLRYPANLGAITIINPELSGITFVLRPQDRIIYTKVRDIEDSGITDGQVLAYNATTDQYEPANNSGGGTPDGSETKIATTGTNTTSSGTGTIADPYVINADITNNLNYDAITKTVTIDTGTDAVLTVVDGTNDGLMVVADKTKLDGVETAADVTDAVNVAAAGAIMTSSLIDDDTFATATVTNIASAESIKAYVDGNSGGTTSNNLADGGEIFVGYGIRVQNNVIQVEANYDCMVIEIEPNTDYIVSGLTSSIFNHKSAFVKKTGSAGTALDYVKLVASEGYQETHLNLHPTADTEEFKFTSPTVLDSSIGKLYILLNLRYSTSDATATINVRAAEHETDNLKYALEQANTPTVNVFDKNSYWKEVGVIYNTFNPPTYDSDYSTSEPIPVDKNEFYSFSGHTLSETGVAGTRRLVFCKKTVNGYTPLTNTEAGGTYVHGTTGNLAYVDLNTEFPDLPAFTLRTPDAAIGTDQLYMVVNVRFQAISSVETLQIEKGSSITDYTPKNVVTTMLGFEVVGSDTTSGGSSTTTQWTNKNITFAGDSIVAGTNGNFVDIIAALIGCIKSNLGSSGAAAGRLVGILTPIKDRDGSSPVATPDYAAIDAVMIMIGTNGAIGGTSADIPAGTYEAAADKTVYLNSFADTYYGNVAMCVEYIKAMNHKTKIYLVTPPHENGTDKTVVRDILKEISEYYSTVFINGLDNAGIDKKNFDRYSPDGTHFNADGNEIWGNYVGYQMQNN